MERAYGPTNGYIADRARTMREAALRLREAAGPARSAPEAPDARLRAALEQICRTVLDVGIDAKGDRSVSLDSAERLKAIATAALGAPVQETYVERYITSTPSERR